MQRKKIAYITIALIIAFVVFGLARARNSAVDNAEVQASKTTDAATSADKSQAKPETAPKVSIEEASISAAAKENRYVFITFHQKGDEASKKMLTAMEAAKGKLSSRASFVSIDVDDPACQEIVSRYGADRSPTPLTLVVAPNGAVTRGFPRKFNESQLLTAFVTPGTATCLKALQSRKLVLLAIQSRSPYVPISLQKGVSDFAADPRYAGATQIVVLDPADPAEAPFFKDLKVDAGTGSPTTVLLAPPGSVVAKFTGIVTKEQIVAKLASAQSGYCPGGKCGPGGCGPKK